MQPDGTSHTHASPQTDALDGLGLADDERLALTRQGSVVTEARGKRIYYKLRFRFQGKQRSCYLGADPERAARVQVELGQLQQARSLARELSQTVQDTAQCFRAGKQATRELLAQHGYYYHGLAIRRTRAVKQADVHPTHHIQLTQEKSFYGTEHPSVP